MCGKAGNGHSDWPKPGQRAALPRDCLEPTLTVANASDAASAFGITNEKRLDRPVRLAENTRGGFGRGRLTVGSAFTLAAPDRGRALQGKTLDPLA